MSTTYAQKQSLTQKKDAPSASSVFDASSQSESLQRKADMVNAATQRAETPRPNNTGMPDDLKAGIESLSGFSMDDVRVHYNSPKPATVQALAYTQGTDIHVAPGQEKHLPHEAWHVAQQMAGRVSPTTNINGMPVNDNAALEHEADVMGEKAVTQRVEKKSGIFNRKYDEHHVFSPIQRFINPDKHSVVLLILKRKKTFTSKKYLEKLESFLDEINEMESRFEADDIAEMLRINDYNVERTRESMIASLGEKLDNRMGEGHIGAEHYAKSEYFQKERMLKEDKTDVTTLEDSARTKKFFTHVKQTVKQNLLIALNDCIEDLSISMPACWSIKDVKSVVGQYKDVPYLFEMYSITIKEISVKGAGSARNTFEVTFDPELESIESYEKIQYSKESRSRLNDNIRMYWGHNKPSVVVDKNTEYSALNDFLKRNIKAPVTGY